MTFYIKENDTAPAFRAILKDGDGNAVNVAGATIRFHMLTREGVVKVDAAAVINDGAAGDVQYEWTAGDTDTPDVYNAEFEVTYADTTVETFPNSSHETVIVFGELQ